MRISSGDAYSANSGDIELNSGQNLGTRAPGTSGKISLATSSITNGNSGDINLASGGSMGGTSGNVTIEAVSHYFIIAVCDESYLLSRLT